MPQELQHVLLVGFFNPIVVAVAIIMASRVDQWQKLIVVGFAAATAGVAFVMLAWVFGIMPITLIFTLSQMPLIMRHSLEQPDDGG